MKRSPGITMVLEYSIWNDEINFIPSFWDEGMTVTITSETGEEWTDFVTVGEPYMFFNGQTGVFTIECETVAGTSFIGELGI